MNNKKAQFETIIGFIFAIIIIVIMASTLVSMFESTSCTSEKQKIDNLNIRINNVTNIANQNYEEAVFWKDQYENLSNSTVTKKDFNRIENSVNLLVQNNNFINQQLTNINSQLTSIKYEKNYYLVIQIFLIFTLSILGFTLVDFTFFKLKFSKWLLQKSYFIRNKVEINIEEVKSKEKDELK